MEIELIDKNEETNELPTFLKVLCILTFVGAGLTIIMSILFTITIQMSLKLVESMDSIAGSSTGMVEVFKWTIVSYILTGVGSLLGLVGALFMWKLKKIGFFIYLIGQIIPIIGVVLVYLAAMKTSFGASSAFGNVITSAFYVLISIAFLIMYGVNLKHLKR